MKALNLTVCEQERIGEMKRIFVLVLGLAIILNSGAAFCDTSTDKLTPRAPGAHMWDDFDNAFKALLIGGLLVGYREGVAVGAASEHRRLKSDTEMSRTAADQLTSKARVLFDKPVSFYVKETDHFMQTSPVCKKMNLTQLLDQLVSVWAAKPLRIRMGYDFIEKTKYKDIEDACMGISK